MTNARTSAAIFNFCQLLDETGMGHLCKVIRAMAEDGLLKQDDPPGRIDNQGPLTRELLSQITQQMTLRRQSLKDQKLPKPAPHPPGCGSVAG